MLAAEDRLRALIRQQGPITFAHFMQEALFASGGGYYSSPRHLEGHGDYFTSPAAHPLFGTILAIQLQQMWELLDEPVTFTVVELGAGSGMLASQITSPQTTVASAFTSALRYVAVDRFAPPGELVRVATADGVGVVPRPRRQTGGSGGRRVDVQQTGHEALDLVTGDDDVADDVIEKLGI